MNKKRGKKGNDTRHWKFSLGTCIFLAAVVVCAGTSASLFSFQTARRWQGHRLRAQFERAALDRVSALNRELEAELLILQSLVRFHAASNKVERDEFRTFVASVLSSHPQIQALEWIPRVHHSQREAYEEAAREDGFPDFQITERAEQGQMVRAPRRQEYFPVYFVQPYKGNEMALGFDMASNPTRLEALNRSRDTGQVAATARITLVQETAKQSGILVLLPVYKKGAPADSLEDRRRNLEGFFLGVFRIGDFVERALASLSPAGVDVHVWDLSAPPGEQFLYFHGSRTREFRGSPGVKEPDVKQSGLHTVVVREVGGRKWQVLCRPTEAFVADRVTRQPWGILVGGLVVTALVTIYLFMMMSHAVHTQRLAGRVFKANRDLEEEIADHKQAERELRRSRESLAEAQQLTHLGNWDWDIERDEIRWSDEVYRIFGLEPQESEPGYDAFLKHVHPADKESVEERVNEALRGEGRLTDDYRVVRPDGSERIVHAEAEVTFSEAGKPVRMLGTVYDITERQWAQEALRQSEQKYYHLFEHLVDAAFLADAETGLIVETNAQGEKLLGRSRGEIVGMHQSSLHPSDKAEQHKRLFAEHIEKGRAVNAEAEVVGKDGTIVPVRINATTMTIGGCRLVLSLFCDTTELKKAEAELREAKVAADQASRAKSEFLANMSHEIRTPMTAILGYTELAIDPHQTSCEQSEALAMIRKNGHHLLSVINDILDISKIEAGKLILVPGRCCVPAVVADVVSMLAGRAAERGLSLSAEYAGQLPETIFTDERRLRQMLVNLVGNAVKFTETGGVRVVTTFLPRWRRQGPAVMIEVIDTGVGIAAEEVWRLCEPFCQADGSASRKYGGTGLGLGITRRLAEMMGGELTARGELGKGSTFGITIPTGSLEGIGMLDNPAEAVGERKVAAELQALRGDSLAGLRILLAEDSLDNRRLIRRILCNAGAEVEVAENGRLAVDSATAGRFDLILMDMQMPEMDGYEATRTLCEQGFSEPIVALTAHAMRGDREKCLSAGCTGYLAKPISPRQLIETVMHHTGRQGAETEQSMQSNFCDDPVLADIIDQYVEALPGHVETMREALDHRDHERLHRLAHQLKGTGGSYGYPALSDLGRRLDDAAMALDTEAAALALKDLAELVHSLVAARRTSASSVEL